MNAVSRGNLNRLNSMARPPVGLGPQLEGLAPAVSRRLRRDLALLLRKGAELAHEQPEDCEAARLHVAQCGQESNELLERWLLAAGIESDPHTAWRLLGVLELTARSDPDGARRVAHNLKRHLDLRLTIYDMIADKAQLFELMPQDEAHAVTQLFRTRRAALALLAALDGIAVETQ